VNETIQTCRQILRQAQSVGVQGRVAAVRGLTVNVADFPAPVGAACRIVRSQQSLEARVVGFAGEYAVVMPTGSTTGISRGDRVRLLSAQPALPVGPGMLGRVLDGRGQPIDGMGAIRPAARRPIWPEPISPMQRRRITQPLATGVRAIDAMLTVGQGQRMGILSGSGVGKSVLLGMIARFTSAPVVVVSLIGERGREVRDFIERDLGPQGLAKSVVIVSTGDEPPLRRVQAGAVATAVAEHFRDQGQDVVLLMDSLTRLAMAQRQIGLAAGEPPSTRGYTPSVFSLLPQLLERAGRTASGSITAFYAVLLEADDLAEPLSDAVRAVTDGYIYLSRDLAVRGHYPAIDCLQSISRLMSDLADAAHQQAAREVLSSLAGYREIYEMVSVGAYQTGGSPEYDRAIRAYPLIREFLAQTVDQPDSLAAARGKLIELAGRIRSLAMPAAGRGRPLAVAARPRERRP
jgi:flagellum-specific ATP synthase